MSKNNLSIYIHYPFCVSKCPYCDFNSYKLYGVNQVDFLNAYLTELKSYYELTKNRTIKTIFFGGGTPSIMSSNFLDKIMTQINSLWGIGDDVEVSMEANPTTAEISKFNDFKQIGINRLSIGVQSLDDEWLKFFGRTHNEREAVRAIELAKNIFGDRYSIDLIYARPRQNIDEWLKELEKAVKLSPFHLSLYQLIVEEGTKFYEDKVKSLNDKDAAKMYKITNDFLENHNMNMYEVSNYAQNGFECQHNLNYWKSGEWIGIGAGAHGRLCLYEKFVDGYRTRTSFENVKNPEFWIKNVMKRGFGYEIRENLTKQEFMEEVLLMGLRLKAGIHLYDIQNYLIIDDVRDLINRNHQTLNNFVHVDETNIAAKPAGFIVLDSIIERLMIDD